MLIRQSFKPLGWSLEDPANEIISDSSEDKRDKTSDT